MSSLCSWLFYSFNTVFLLIFINVFVHQPTVSRINSTKLYYATICMTRNVNLLAIWILETKSVARERASYESGPYESGPPFRFMRNRALRNRPMFIKKKRGALFCRPNGPIFPQKFKKCFPAIRVIDFWRDEHTLFFPLFWKKLWSD